MSQRRLPLMVRNADLRRQIWAHLIGAGCGLCREQGGLGSLVTRLFDKFEPRFCPTFGFARFLINSSVS